MNRWMEMVVEEVRLSVSVFVVDGRLTLVRCRKVAVGSVVGWGIAKLG